MGGFLLVSLYHPKRVASTKTDPRWVWHPPRSSPLAREEVPQVPKVNSLVTIGGVGMTKAFLSEAPPVV